MINAEELFKNLCYYKIELNDNHNPWRLIYERVEITDGERKDITFFRNGEIRVKLRHDNGHIDYTDLGPKEIEAIYQQCKELGWLE